MTISKSLKQFNLISGDKIEKIFDEKFSDILTYPYDSPSQFMRHMWDRFENITASINGKVFEGLIATILYRENIQPIYVQAKLAFVPNVDFDFVLYSRQIGPVVLSAKTSLRERYKQADLEGMMIKQVHRKSRNFLITLDPIEANSVNTKIDDGKALGLDQVIVANEIGFDNMIDELRELDFYAPEPIEIITSSKIIGTIQTQK